MILLIRGDDFPHIMKAKKIAILFVALFLLSPILRAKDDLNLGKKGTIFIFVASHCPCSDPHRLLIQSLVQQYREKGVSFQAVFSNKNESQELAKRFMKQNGWDFDFVIDQNGKVMKNYQAKITPEAFLLNPKGEILYRGAIDDSVSNMGQIKNPYLKTALVQFLSGKKIDPRETPPYGCYIVR